MMNEFGGASSFIFIIILLVVYMLPAFVAYGRFHHNSGAILLLNLFLGWTFLGWVGALIWAATEVKSPKDDCIESYAALKQEKELPESDTKTCPYCAETIKRAAVVCRYCGRELAPEEPQIK